MDVKLKVVVGANAGQDVPVGSKFFIGRAEDCQLRPKSDLISRHHCVVLVDQDLVSVRDLGSRNGTYVNDQRVVGERALKQGDHLRVGPLEFEVHVQASPVPTPHTGAAKRPPVTSVRDAALRTAQSGVAAANSDDVSSWLGENPPTAGETRPVEAAPSIQQTVSLPMAASTDFELPQAPINQVAAPIPAPVVPATTETVATTLPNPAVTQTIVQRGPSVFVPESPTASPPPSGSPQPGAKPAPAKPAGKGNSNDSGKAAADTLRNFFRRR